ncbi:hypothetical protein [Lysinibacillus sp. RS5]|uniref:hypothetical protein n=1 Tax=unclassified Lysinibacillus TaxID=2636778 RepID=UPI0035BE52FF
MKNLFYLMFIVMIIAGCNGIPSSHSDSFGNPVGRVIVDDEGYMMQIGDFELKDDDVTIRSLNSPDKYGLAEEFETLTVEKGDKIRIEIDQNPPSIIVNQENEDGTIDNIEIQNNEITLPTEKGYYIYEVIAKLNEGKSTFVFDLNIE